MKIELKVITNGNVMRAYPYNVADLNCLADPDGKHFLLRDNEVVLGIYDSADTVNTVIESIKTVTEQTEEELKDKIIDSFCADRPRIQVDGTEVKYTGISFEV